ncbi:hypothetical protein AC1031_016985 [Aphanomyces cochlioides]|nr:hypothetical protein AC1031_016985 [Aphanomyces cochlioides]
MGLGTTRIFAKCKVARRQPMLVGTVSVTEEVEGCTKFARTGGLCYHHGGVLRETTANDVSSEDDDDILAYIMDDIAKMELSSVGALLAETCNCDFTEEKHEILGYFVSDAP